MKKWLVVIAGIALGGFAIADSKVYTTTVNQIGAEPDAGDPTVGMSMQDVTGYRVSICSTGGRLTAVGVDAGTAKIDIYYFNERIGQWQRNKYLDEYLTVGNGSCGQQPCACEVFPDHESVAASEGRILPVISGGKWADAGSPTDAGWFTIRIDARVVPVRR